MAKSSDAIKDMDKDMKIVDHRLVSSSRLGTAADEKRCDDRFKF
jgi:hypothetical protein